MNYQPPQKDADKPASAVIAPSVDRHLESVTRPKKPMMRQYELVERVHAYDPSANEDLLNKAYVFAMKAHGTQMRASGDPYFSHPLEVASILTEMKMDAASIATALLHDTIEDTGATEEDLKKLFGDEVARLVVGVTKLGRLEFQSDKAHQAENFRKLIVAMAEDIRVLLVKLADRLHNMRTMHFVKKEEKRRQKSAETLDIYAPLAERMGIKQMQEELEDLAFAELHPDARESILARLRFLRQEGSGLATTIITELQQLMDKSGVKAKVVGREKTPYSIWRKMQRKNIAFEQLSDIIAFRIVVDDLAECYHALGVLHSHYSVVPGRFKDYISTPKPNGYQSLHTGVIGPLKHRIEVQIRTAHMDEVAELGVAAHWSYKEGGSGKTDGKQYRWLRELLDIVESAQKPEEFLDYTRLELFQDQVFCFTPKGDLVALTRNSTPVDFAYAVHSKVGDKCVGAKVNGRMVPLRTQLRNGDQVEIITSKTGAPSPAWERFVVSAKARSHIRRFVRQQQRAEYVALGKPMIQKLFVEEGVAFVEKDIEEVVNRFQSEDLDDLYANIGASLQSPRDVLKALFPAHVWRVETNKQARKPGVSAPSGKPAKPLTLRGLIPGMAVHYARCCHPLPGDRIVGIVTTGKGVTIHTSDCDTLESFAGQPERWIDVAWEETGPNTEKVVGRLSVIISNSPGALANLTGAISRSGGNIINLKITNRTVDFFDVFVDVEVSNVDQLNTIMAGLRATPLMISVERAKNR
jgi:GTP pyrophosphokinase